MATKKSTATPTPRLAEYSAEDFNGELARRRDRDAVREERRAEILDDLYRLTPQQFDKVEALVGALHAKQRQAKRVRVN